MKEIEELLDDCKAYKLLLENPSQLALTIENENGEIQSVYPRSIFMAVHKDVCKECRDLFPLGTGTAAREKDQL